MYSLANSSNIRMERRVAVISVLSIFLVYIITVSIVKQCAITIKGSGHDTIVFKTLQADDFICNPKEEILIGSIYSIYSEDRKRSSGKRRDQVRRPDKTILESKEPIPIFLVADDEVAYSILSSKFRFKMDIRGILMPLSKSDPKSPQSDARRDRLKIPVDSLEGYHDGCDAVHDRRDLLQPCDNLISTQSESKENIFAVPIFQVDSSDIQRVHQIISASPDGFIQANVGYYVDTYRSLELFLETFVVAMALTSVMYFIYKRREESSLSDEITSQIASKSTSEDHHEATRNDGKTDSLCDSSKSNILGDNINTERNQNSRRLNRDVQVSNLDTSIKEDQSELLQLGSSRICEDQNDIQMTNRVAPALDRTLDQGNPHIASSDVSLAQQQSAVDENFRYSTPKKSAFLFDRNNTPRTRLLSQSSMNMTSEEKNAEYFKRLREVCLDS